MYITWWEKLNYVLVCEQGLYPISYSFVESFRFPTKTKNLNNHQNLPHIIVQRIDVDEHIGIQRTYVELDLGLVN